MLDSIPTDLPAACAGDPDLPFRADERRFRDELTLLRHLCNRCPLQPGCRSFGLQHPNLSGVWGGLTTQQRKRRSRSHSRPKKPTPGALEGLTA